MCGYCFEASYINNYEQYLRGEPIDEIDNFNIVGYLQELHNLHEIEYCYLQEGAYLPHHVIFQARIAASKFEETCFHNADNPFYNHPIHQEYFSRRSALLKQNPVLSLETIAQYIEDNSTVSVNYSSYLLAHAEVCLNWFSQHFMAYKNELGTEQEPHEKNSALDWDDWYVFSAELLFSFRYVIRFNPDFLLFKKLVTGSLKKCPLTGIDLWLLRTVFIHTLKQYGLEFLEANSPFISTEQVYYAILRRAINYSDLPRIKSIKFNSLATSNEDICSLIDELMAENWIAAV